MVADSPDVPAPPDRPMMVVTLVAAVVRALWLLAPMPAFGDADEYRRLAGWLVARHLFSTDGIVPSSYRPPLYPALIACLDLLTRHPIPALLILQVVLSTLTVPLVATAAADRFGRQAGWMAGLMLAFAPMTARFSTLVLTETLFTFLIVAAVLAWSRGRPTFGGVALGLAALTRASTMPYVLALLAFGLLGRRTRARRDAVILSLAALLTVTPWAVRNRLQVGHWSVADAGWGANLFYGTVDLRGGSNRWAQLIAAQAQMNDGLQPTSVSPAGADAAEWRAAMLAMSRIRAHPAAWIRVRMRQWPWLLVDTGDYLPVAANRVSFSEAVATRRLSTLALKLGFLAGHSLVLLFAAIGLWSCRPRLVETLPLWSFPVYLMLAHLPVYVEPRYGLPLVPFVAMFAAAGLRAYGVADRRLPLNRAILAAR